MSTHGAKITKSFLSVTQLHQESCVLNPLLLYFDGSQTIYFCKRASCHTLQFLRVWGSNKVVICE